MCLSTVYSLKGVERELLMERVAKISQNDDQSLVLEDLMGRTLMVEGKLASVDLIENVVYIKDNSRE